MNRGVLARLWQHGGKDAALSCGCRSSFFQGGKANFTVHPWCFHAAPPQETLVKARARGEAAHSRAATNRDRGVRLALEGQHLPMPLLKGNNLRQRSKARAGTSLVSPFTASRARSPSLLTPGEETHGPWDTEGFTLLLVGDGAKLQLVLVCRPTAVFLFSSLGMSGAGSQAQRHGSGGQDGSTEQLETPLLGRAEPRMLVGAPVGSCPGWAPRGEGFNVQLDQDLPRTLHPSAFSLDP